MNILHAWKNSLSIFKPTNFKNFLIDTFKAMRETYQVWFTYWWCLIGLYLLGGIYIFRPLTNLSTPLMISGFFRDIDLWYVPALIASSLLVLLYVTLFISAQPTKHKSYAYFLSYAKHTVVITVWFFIVSGLYIGYRSIFGELLDYQKKFGGTFSQFIPALILALTSCMIILLAFFTLFFIASLLDFNSSTINIHKAFVRALKIVAYNIPFCLMLAALCFATYALILVSLSWGLYKEYVHFCFDILAALPFLICTTSSFYYQQLKAHPGLYK